MFVFAGFAIWFTINHIQDDDTLAVPADYRVAIAELTSVKLTTYYVYDDKIILKNEFSKSDGTPTSETLVYDGVDTSKIQYSGDDATTVCEVKECKNKKKVLSAIKSTISGKVSREYIGK